MANGAMLSCLAGRHPAEVDDGGLSFRSRFRCRNPSFCHCREKRCRTLRNVFLPHFLSTRSVDTSATTSFLVLEGVKLKVFHVHALGFLQSFCYKTTRDKNTSKDPYPAPSDRVLGTGTHDEFQGKGDPASSQWTHCAPVYEGTEMCCPLAFSSATLSCHVTVISLPRPRWSVHLAARLLAPVHIV